MKKYVYLFAIGLLYATINTQIFAYEYNVDNTTDKEIDVTLKLKAAMLQDQKPMKKTIAPRSTVKFNFGFSAFCLDNAIKYMIDPSPSKYKDLDSGRYSPGTIEKYYRLPNPICNNARISIVLSSKPDEVEFVIK